MHVRSLALVAVVSMLAALGCSKAPTPLTEPSTLLSEAQSGALDMAIFSGEGAARQVQSAKGCTGKKKYGLQYVFSDIDHIRVTVSSTLLATPLVRDVNCTTEFVDGRGHIRFASLLAGAYQVRVEAYLADGTLIGTQLLDVTVVAGRTVVVAVSVQLTDTHVVSTTHGHLGANITFVDGNTVADVVVDADHDGFPLITGICAASPTPTPTSSLQITTVDSNKPFAVAFDSSGNAWVTNSQSVGTVTKYAPDGTTLGTFTVGNQAWGDAVDSLDYVWVANRASNTLSKLDTDGNLVGTFATRSEPLHLAVDGTDDIWVTNYGDNSVSKYAENGTLLGTFSVGSQPVGIAIENSGRVWVANSVSNTVSVLSSDGTIIGTYNAGTNPQRLALDQDGDIWIGHGVGNLVTKMGPTGAVLGNFTLANVPSCIAVDRDGDIWVSNRGDNTVTELDTNGQAIQTIPVGTWPGLLNVSPSNAVWVPNTRSNSISIIEQGSVSR